MSNKLSPVLQLSNGRPIPQVGYGTFDSCPHLEEAVGWALDTGYRLIDTAALYFNEEQIGNAVKKYLAGHPELRLEDLFITSKVRLDDILLSS